MEKVQEILTDTPTFVVAEPPKQDLWDTVLDQLDDVARRLDLDPGRPQLTGTHDVAGVFIASGPAFKASGRFEDATIFDIAPTALAVIGLPVGEDMDGRALTELIEERHLAARPVSFIPSYEPVVGKEREDTIVVRSPFSKE